MYICQTWLNILSAFVSSLETTVEDLPYVIQGVLVDFRGVYPPGSWRFDKRGVVFGNKAKFIAPARLLDGVEP